MCIEFEPKTAGIEAAVEAERELIRVAYERQKTKKEHPSRMALPSHLPVVETVIEPSEDTTDNYFSLFTQSTSIMFLVKSIN